MTKPLTGYEKEIAILHAEARQDAELIFEFKGLANEYKQAIERVRELHKKDWVGNCKHCSFLGDDDWSYPCRTIRTLDGEQ